ncbi:MAG: PAS domain-containing protein [Emcibacter sp.]|nr:PAS domain-containing protein [Emcibacter sp.]
MGDISDTLAPLSVASERAKQKSKEELVAEIFRLHKLIESTQYQTKTAYWEYVIETQDITFSEYAYKLVGLEPYSIKLTNEIFDELIHPDDRDMFVAMRNKLASEGIPDGFEYRLLVNGKTKHIKLTSVLEKNENGVGIRVMGATQDITDLKYNEGRLRKINLFAQDLMTLHSEQDLIWYVVKQVVSELDLEDCVIYLLDKNTNELVQSATYGLKSGGDRVINNKLRIKVGEGITGHVAMTKTPLIIDDITKDDRYIADIPGMGSEICVPIIHEGQLFGVIDSEHSEINYFTENDQNLLNTIATLLAAKLGQWDNLEKIKTSEAQYREAQRIAHFGSWDWDLKNNIIKLSNETYLIMGLIPQEKAIDFKQFRKCLHPDDVEALTTTVEQMTHIHNDFDANFRIVRPDGEIRHIQSTGEAFFDDNNSAFRMSGSMLDITKIKIAEDALMRHKENLEMLVEERTASMKSARDEAEQANKAKSEFLSQMSHELRTPLNAILGFGQLLKLDSDLLNEIQQDNVEEILSAGSHLLELINDILDLTKIETRKLKISISKIHIDEIIPQCLTLIAAPANERHLNITTNIKNTGHVIMSDGTRFRQVMLNLLSNAVKYNRDYGDITLDYKIMDENHLRIYVTDTGMGLSENEIANLYTPFERFNKTINVEGTGIGLVITKTLVELMGGTMGVESIVGKGCSFWVEFLRSDPASMT